MNFKALKRVYKSNFPKLFEHTSLKQDYGFNLCLFTFKSLHEHLERRLTTALILHVKYLTRVDKSAFARNESTWLYERRMDRSGSELKFQFVKQYNLVKSAPSARSSENNAPEEILPPWAVGPLRSGAAPTPWNRHKVSGWNIRNTFQKFPYFQSTKCHVETRRPTWRRFSPGAAVLTLAGLGEKWVTWETRLSISMIPDAE